MLRINKNNAFTSICIPREVMFFFCKLKSELLKWKKKYINILREIQ